jgi:membrane protease YdiL (CAAX protease family)
MAFFLLTFALTWTCFGTVAILTRHGSLSIAGHVLLLLGTFAPSIVAVWLTSRSEGRAGVAALLERTLWWRVEAQWYLFAVALFPTIKLAAALTHRALTGAWPRFGEESLLTILAAIIFSTPVQGGEEVGWRGYALPRMAARLGFGSASVLLGAIWGVWHLPLFFVRGDDFGQPFILFAMGTTALSVAMAWLYANTKGSLLLTMLMHSAVNQTVGIVPDTRSGPGNPFSLRAPTTFYLTVGFLWIAAFYFLYCFRGVPAGIIEREHPIAPSNTERTEG